MNRSRGGAALVVREAFLTFLSGAAKFSSPLLTLCLAVAWAGPAVVVAESVPSLVPSELVPSEPVPSDLEAVGTVTFESHVAPFIKRYCTDCHGKKKPKAQMNLGAYKDTLSVIKDRKVWEKVLEAIVHREMPPPKKKRQPSEAVGATLPDPASLILPAAIQSIHAIQINKRPRPCRQACFHPGGFQRSARRNRNSNHQRHPHSRRLADDQAGT